jgi:hypothetical protein
MSAPGQTRRFWPVRSTSAFPPIATAEQTSREVRFVPNNGRCRNHLVSVSVQHLWNGGDRAPYRSSG